MSKVKKKVGRPFEKGNKGGPGAPSAPPDIKRARALTRYEFERIANKFLFMRKEEFRAAVAALDTEMLEMTVASIIQKAVLEGDDRRLNFLLDRLIGKVVQPISDTDGNPLPIVQLFIPPNGREASHISRGSGEPINAEHRHIDEDEDAEA